MYLFTVSPHLGAVLPPARGRGQAAGCFLSPAAAEGGCSKGQPPGSPGASEHHGAVSPPCEPTAEEDTGLRHRLGCRVLSPDGNGWGWGTKPMEQRQC